MTETIVKQGRRGSSHADAAVTLEVESADALQSALLRRVSRTFALTIPLLPDRLRGVVSNAYLLCRVLDTIEDEPLLAAARKRELCEGFVRVVTSGADPEAFAAELSSALTERTSRWEHELIRHVPRIIAATRGLGAEEQRALGRCVATMSGGMMEFQERVNAAGLASLDETDRYCYFVAGVVGEMLTRLFVLHDPAIARNEARLMNLAASFGKGLQLTNILKDVWEDRARGACWLPRDILDPAAAGTDVRFRTGLVRLVGVAHAHLRNALQYILLIPSEEPGIRKFCFAAVGMALLTLRRIRNRPDFRTGADVKISRRSVRWTLVGSRLCSRSDLLLRLLFAVTGFGLPVAGEKDMARIRFASVSAETC